MIHMNVFAESREKNTWFAILRSRNFAQISVFCWYSCLAQPHALHTTKHNRTGCVYVAHSLAHAYIHTFIHKCTYVLSNDYIICCFSHMSCEVQACACFKFRNYSNEFWPIRKDSYSLAHRSIVLTRTHIHSDTVSMGKESKSKRERTDDEWNR